jgi:hypothetical protein
LTYFPNGFSKLIPLGSWNAQWYHSPPQCTHVAFCLAD